VTYVAFLRAINVGGHTVKMDRLRAIFEELGFDEVETFIASGNVIFGTTAAAKTLDATIEKALHDALGYEVITFLRTSAEIAEIGDDDENGLYVAFLKSKPPAAAQKKLLAFNSDLDHFHFRGREVYWRPHGVKLTDSPFFTKHSLEKVLGMPATMRNMNTVRRIAAKISSTR
jgi:uncharacterized protein (DUF1697 family)